MIGILGLAISFFLTGISTESWMLFVARIVGGILSSANMPTAMAYVADITSAAQDCEKVWGSSVLQQDRGLYLVQPSEVFFKIIFEYPLSLRAAYRY